MENLTQILIQLLTPTTYKIILSNPRSGDAAYQKITLNRLKKGWQAEKRTHQQIFHENLSPAALPQYLEEHLRSTYTQCNAWSAEQEFSLRITKQNKLLFSKKRAATPPAPKNTHNREKNYILKEGTPIPPLVDLGVFTKEGKVVNAMYDKFKQLNRFLEILDDEVTKTRLTAPVRIVDFGCGKSYLTFLIYYYFTQIKQIPVHMTGLDLKADVIANCTKTAADYGYENLSFQVGDVSDYKTTDPVDIVLSLHACDTATDYALFHAISRNAKLIFSVPCCQHELNAQIASDEFSILTNYGIIKERTAALFTDAIRANLLEHCGYKTQVLEFIDFAHTPKNLLLRAKRTRPASSTPTKALAEAETLMSTFTLQPTLHRLLQEKNFIPPERK